MRSLLLAIVVAASGCHGAKQAGPAWPAPSKTADDGGQSIEPKQASVATSVEKSTDDDADTDKPEAPAAKSAVSEDKPLVPTITPSVTPTEPVMLDDEIIIEVDD